MKRIISCLSVLMLVLASCASNKSAGQTGEKERTGESGKQIPVEVKMKVLFADGSLDEYMVSEYDDSLSGLRKQNHYSASGALVEQVEYIYQEDTGLLTEKKTIDAENRPQNRWVYQYDDQGRLQKETLINKSDKPVMSYVYTYDSGGNRTGRTLISGMDIKMAETVYVFNNSGVILSSETLDSAGNKISSSINRFDADNNLISQEMYNANGQMVSVINSVWENGLELTNEQLGLDGVVQMQVTNEYGADGELIRKSFKNARGDSVQTVEYEYAYKPER